MSIHDAGWAESFFQYFYKQYQVSIIDRSLLKQNHKKFPNHNSGRSVGATVNVYFQYLCARGDYQFYFFINRFSRISKDLFFQKNPNLQQVFQLISEIRNKIYFLFVAKSDLSVMWWFAGCSESCYHRQLPLSPSVYMQFPPVDIEGKHLAIFRPLPKIREIWHYPASDL